MTDKGGGGSPNGSTTEPASGATIVSIERSDERPAGRGVGAAAARPRRRPRRAVAIAAACLVAVGAIGVVAWRIARRGEVVAGCEALERPALAGDGAEPIALRYVARAGDRTAFDVHVRAGSELHAADGADTVRWTTLDLEGAITWTGSDGDAAMGALELARLSLDDDSRRPGPDGEPVTVHAVGATTDDAPSPAVATLRALVGVRIPVRVGARGDVTAASLDSIRAALTRADLAPEVARAAVDDLALGAFVRLADKPVARGARWPAGSFVRTAGGAELAGPLDVELAAVAGDQAVLAIAPALAPTSDSGRVHGAAAASGWWLFDVAHGRVARAVVHTCATLDVPGGTLTHDLTTTYAGTVSNMSTEPSPASE